MDISPEQRVLANAISRPFGAELRRLREASGRSLTELARALHYSKSFLSKVETGHSRPNETLARQCEAILGAAPGSLVGLIARRPTSRAASLSARVVDLPRPTQLFVGRAAELERIIAGLDDQTRMVVVYGPPGIGKTEIVVQAACRVVGRYAHGCVYLDLQGRGVFMDAFDAAAGILGRLGVPFDAIPAEHDERMAFYRRVLRDRHLLIVIDNPGSASAVNELLPGGAADMLVGSRRRLNALDEAALVELQPLDIDKGRDLFVSMTSARLGAEPDALAVDTVDRIVTACSGHPLAIRIAAARFRGTPAMRLADLAAEVAHERRRVDALNDGERSVASVFESAFAALQPRQARTLELLSVHVGATLDARTVGLLANVDRPAAQALLTELATACLITQRSPDRYAFHELVRAVAYARLSQSDIDVATGRLLTGYLHATQWADVTLTPQRHRSPSVNPSSPTWYGGFSTPSVAATFMDDEHQNLVRLCEVAHECGYDDVCWKLAYGLRDHFFRTNALRSWISTHEAALRSCRRLDDRSAIAVTLNNLGLAHAVSRQFDVADVYYTEALALFRAIDDPYGEANAIGHLAWTAHGRGDHQGALANGRAAWAIYERLDVPRNAAITLRTIALAEAALGQTAEAIAHLHQALATFVSSGLILDETMALNCLGDVVGDEEAIDYYRRALFRAQDCRSAVEEARAMRGLAQSARRRGYLRAADRLEEQAAAVVCRR